MIYDYQNNPIVCTHATYEEPEEQEQKIVRKQSVADVVMMNTLIKESSAYQNEFEKYKSFSDELLKAQHNEIEHLKAQIRERDEKMGGFLKEYEEKLKQIAPIVQEAAPAPIRELELLAEYEKNKAQPIKEKKVVTKNSSLLSKPKLKPKIEIKRTPAGPKR